MSLIDIIARLKLNGQGFTSEFERQLGDVESRAGRSGKVIGRNLSEGIGGGLQEAASRVPVIGGALTGLSGVALTAAAGLGVLSTAFINGVREAEGYATAVRGLDAILEATGNKAGFARDQLVSFAADLEGKFAIPQEEIIAAEKALSSFDGVAGSTFKRAITGAADMAAVFGGDLASNTEKVGLALQNLAQGNVEGLSKAFKFLGTDTLETVKALAEAGKTAQAQDVLLAALEQRIGGAAGANADGLSGAFFRLKDTVNDATREFAEQTGVLPGLISLINSLNSALGGTSADGYSDLTNRLAKAKAEVAQLQRLYPDGKTDTLLGSAAVSVSMSRAQSRVRDLERQLRERPQGLDDDPYGLGGIGSWDDLMARRAAASAYANRQNSGDKKGSKSDAEKAAERAAQQEKRLTDQIEKTKLELEQSIEIQRMRADGLDYEADLQEALYRLYRQFPDVDRDRLKALEQLTRQQVELNAAVEAEKDLEQGAKKAQQVARRANEELARQKKQAEDAARAQIADLADYYEMLFGSGTGSIWKQFKNEGRRAIAEIAAAYTLALISGQKPTLEGVLGGLSAGGGSVFSTQGGGLFGQAIGGILTGGLFGGSKGVLPGDQPAIPGLPGTGTASGSVLGAGSGAIGSILSGAAIGGVLGGQTGSSTGGAVGGALGSAVGSAIGGPIGGMIGSLAGSLLGGLVGGVFKKDKKGISTLSLVDGSVVAGAPTGNSGSRKASAVELGGGIADALRGIADALGGELGGSLGVSVGVRNGKYVVDPTGRGMTKQRNGAVHFDTQEAAIEYAIRDAVSDGVITGISAASQNILRSGKDLEKAIEMAVDIESIPKRLRAIEDPLGAAIDALNEKWEKSIDALELGGATAEQWADAQKLYGLELEQVKSSTNGAAASLKEFRDSLAFGSSSPLSLRDQEAAAKAALQPFLDRINGGQAIDQQAYQSAAQSFLDIERQLYGSTEAFFTQFDTIRAATNKAIAAIDNAQPIAESPFVKATADAAAKTADSTRATAEILSQQTDQLSAILQQLQSMGGVGGAAFIGAARGFS